MNFPNRVYIDISSYCNHKCIFCSNSDSRTVKSILSLDKFKKVLLNIMNHVEIKELGLYGKGEPFLNKDILEFIRYAKNKKIDYVFITTNGTLLNEKISYEILNSGLDSIKFSINALDKKEYFKIHGKDEFEKVLDNLCHIVQLKKTIFSKVKILISTINKNLNEEKVINFFITLLKDDFKYIDLIFYYPPGFTPKLSKKYLESIDLKNLCSRDI